MRQCPRDQQSLALTTRKRVDALRDQGLHAHGHGLDVISESRQPCDLPGLVNRQLGSAADVFIDAAGGEPGILQYDTDLPAQQSKVDGLERFAVDETDAGLRRVESSKNYEDPRRPT